MSRERTTGFRLEQRVRIATLYFENRIEDSLTLNVKETLNNFETSNSVSAINNRSYIEWDNGLADSEGRVRLNRTHSFCSVVY